MTPEYFQARVLPVSCGCWVWLGQINKEGYGVYYRHEGMPNRRQRVHRLIYEQANGPIPPGLCVLHTCDNPSCVNPDHLYVGTRWDNAQDMLERSRGNNQFGKERYGKY